MLRFSRIKNLTYFKSDAVRVAVAVAVCGCGCGCGCGRHHRPQLGVWSKLLCVGSVWKSTIFVTQNCHVLRICAADLQSFEY